MLVSTAMEFLSAKLVFSGNLSQPFWDEIPIVTFLHAASSCAALLGLSSLSSTCSFPRPSRFSVPNIHLPFPTPSIPTFIPQGDAYTLFMQAWYPPKWKEFIRRRLRGPFQLGAHSIAAVDFDNIFTVLRRMPHHIAMSWVKTIANGWATSSRLHCDDILPCIFCGAHSCDELLHYISCPTLAAWIRQKMLAPLSDCLTVSLAISPCDFLTIKYVFVKFFVYHSVRLTYNTYIPSSPQRWRAVCENSIATASAKFESLSAGSVLLA